MTAAVRSTVCNLIRSRILLSGPIPVADYMRLALTAQPITRELVQRNENDGGYYMKKDVFGQHGDFITSPEISPLFAEMLAVWGLQTWMQIGGPKKFNIVELGPGRGTLSKDILRVFKQFKHITGSDVALHLVEISPFLATIQSASLAPSPNSNSDAINAKIDGTGTPDTNNGKMQPLLNPLQESLDEGISYYHQAIEADTGFPVYWYRRIQDVPLDFHWYIAHEFFDALPIHKLQKIGNEWKEVLVDINPEKESSFKLVLSKNETPFIQVLRRNYPSVLKQANKREHVEVSLDALSTLEELTSRLNKYGGLSSIIDYGHEGSKGDTFRAFHNHKLHDPLEEPGKADLTADVDFSIIKEVFDDRVMICGPTAQHDFLSRIGIQHRLQVLLQNCKAEDIKHLQSGYDMIMEEMGTRFQVMTLLPSILKSCMPKLQIAGHAQDNAEIEVL